MNMTYQQAMSFLAKAKCTNTGRPVAHKTRMQLHIHTYFPPSATLQYNNTRIVEWRHDHTLFTNGGHMTQTTKSRLNDYLPNGYRIKQVWSVGTYKTRPRVFCGDVAGQILHPQVHTRRRTDGLRMDSI